MNEDSLQNPTDYTSGYSGYSAPRNPSMEPTSHTRREVMVPLRMYRLLWVLAFLLMMVIGPFVLERFQYANTVGKERAKVDVAIEGLSELDKLSLDGLAEASRLVAQRMGPSVVHIKTERTLGRDDESGRIFGFPQQQQQAQGEGSGVIVDAAGFIVTNNHVISGADSIEVQLADGRQFMGKVVGKDPATDIAIVEIDAEGLIAAPWGDSEKLEVGDLIWAVGSPFGLDRTVTFGIVSAKGRRAITENIRYQNFLQTDAAVNPGNSGGPLVNIRGEVVGINTAIVGITYSGISFAIPSSIAQPIYEALRAGTSVPRGWLGVTLSEVHGERAVKLGVGAAQAVVVEAVSPNSPAHQAGLRPGDVIQAWNSKNIRDSSSLIWEVATTKPGSTATAKVLRAGQEISLPITVQANPN